MAARDVRIVEAGDAALVAEFEPRIDPVLNARAVALAQALRAERIAGVLDVVPAFRTVTTYFDPLVTSVETLAAAIERHAAATADASAGMIGETIEVPVCYGGEFGPDLPEVARQAGMAEAAVVERHAAAVYRVYMPGFVPGFAYLGLVDPAIAIPRRSEPRTRVPAGSVALAGRLTGIYPSVTPGGWQIIGRTPRQTHDASRAGACLLRPGAAVRFRPIDRAAFDAHAAQARAR